MQLKDMMLRREIEKKLEQELVEGMISVSYRPQMPHCNLESHECVLSKDKRTINQCKKLFSYLS